MSRSAKIKFLFYLKLTYLDKLPPKSLNCTRCYSYLELKKAYDQRILVSKWKVKHDTK